MQANTPAPEAIAEARVLAAVRPQVYGVRCRGRESSMGFPRPAASTIAGQPVPRLELLVRRAVAVVKVRHQGLEPRTR